VPPCAATGETAGWRERGREKVGGKGAPVRRDLVEQVNCRRQELAEGAVLRHNARMALHDQASDV
jgi:hypothetical protein